MAEKAIGFFKGIFISLVWRGRRKSICLTGQNSAMNWAELFGQHSQILLLTSFDQVYDLGVKFNHIFCHSWDNLAYLFGILISFYYDFLLKSQAGWSKRILERIDSQCLEVRFNVMDNFGGTSGFDDMWNSVISFNTIPEYFLLFSRVLTVACIIVFLVCENIIHFFLPNRWHREDK